MPVRETGESLPMGTTDLSQFVVIFDLDGTLVDSAPDLTATLNVILQAQGLWAVPPEKVRGMVGHGARALLRAGFAYQEKTFPEDERGDAMLEAFVDYYRDHIADHSAPFPGCEATLERLATAGATLAVCTNKLEALAFPLLEMLSLRDHFQVILGRDSLPTYKPDPAPLLEILRRTNRPHGIMIGDTDTDRGAARAAGMRCAIASFGYGNTENLDPKREQRFDHFEALPQLIFNWAAQHAAELGE